MSKIDGVEPLDLLPDRLAIAEFSGEEFAVVLGESADRELSRDNFNWLAAYLVEQAGLYEGEVSDWFTGGAKGLKGKRPLDVWQKLDGFTKVFDYAKAYKLAADEALAEDGEVIAGVNPDLVRSHGIANSALGTILRSFQVAQVDLQPEDGSRHTASFFISNPEKPDSPAVRWRGNEEMEEYRVYRTDGERASIYYIVRYVGEDAPGMIIQSGIGESFRGETVNSSSDSDINGRAPSASEVASFMIPLANEAKNKTLALLTS